MKILKQEKTGSRVKIDVEVNHEDYSAAFDKVLREASLSLKIPGFRPGKAPRNVIEQNLNMDFVKEKTVDRIVENNYAGIVKESGIEPVGYPEWKQVSLEEGGGCVFSVEVDVMPEIKLGAYKGVKAEKKVKKIEEQDIDDYVKALLEEGAKVEEVSGRAVKNGDIVELDIEGSVEAKAQDSLSQKSLPILIGDNRVAPCFDENIIGMEISGEKQFSLILPEEYYIKEFAGKECAFNVSVKRILERHIPEFDDEFVKKISSFNTAAEYRADIRKRLEDAAINKAEADLKDAILEKAASQSTVEIPNAILDREENIMIDELNANLDRRGLNIDSYLQSRRIGMEDLKKEIHPTARARSRAKLVLRAVSKAENIEVTDEDFNAEARIVAKESGVTEDECRKNDGMKDYIKDYLLRRKALDFIVENAKIVEK